MVINVSPQRVLKAFFEADALHAWWQVAHAVTMPRVLGPYAVAWETTEYRDEVLGRLGGVFRGTVMQFQADRGFFVADAFWLPPDGDPIGPMALQITCQAQPGGCKLIVRQDGYEPSPRWRRYYAIVSRGWQLSLTALKRYAEAALSPPRG